MDKLELKEVFAIPLTEAISCHHIIAFLQLKHNYGRHPARCTILHQSKLESRVIMLSILYITVLCAITIKNIGRGRQWVLGGG